MHRLGVVVLTGIVVVDNCAVDDDELIAQQCQATLAPTLSGLMVMMMMVMIALMMVGH